MPPAPATPPPGAPVEPVLADDQVLHLLRRTSFGPTNAMVARAHQDGVDAWLHEQLAPESIDDSACEERLRRFPMLDRTARRGNCMFMLGGGVKGGQVYTTWPGLDNDDRGDLTSVVDYRQVLGEWMTTQGGLGSVSEVFPGFDYSPLGFTG